MTTLYVIAVLLFLALLAHEWLATRARRGGARPRGRDSAAERAHLMPIARGQLERVTGAERAR